MNGEKAFVYFISAGQINILTPPDLAAGPVNVQVNNNGSPSTTFTVQAQTLAQSFFVVNGGPYVVAARGSGQPVAAIRAIPGGQEIERRPAGPSPWTAADALAGLCFEDAKSGNGLNWIGLGSYP